MAGNIQDLIGRLLLRDEGFSTGIKKAEGEVAKLASTTTSTEAAVQRAFTGMATSVLGAGVAFLSVTRLATSLWGEVQRVADAMDELGDAADRLRIAPDRLQALRLQAIQLDASTQDLNQGLKILSRNFGDAIGGSEEARKKFQALGIDVDKLAQSGGDTIDVLRAVADRFKGGALGSEEMSKAIDLLGRSSEALIPLLRQGGDGMKAFEERVKGSGQIIRTDLIKEVDELKHKGEELDARYDALLSGWAVKLEQINNLWKEMRNTIVGIFSAPVGNAPGSLAAAMAGGMNGMPLPGGGSGTTTKAPTGPPPILPVSIAESLTLPLTKYFGKSQEDFLSATELQANEQSLIDTKLRSLALDQEIAIQNKEVRETLARYAEEEQKAAEAAKNFNQAIAAQIATQKAYDKEMELYNKELAKSTDATLGFQAGIQDFVNQVGAIGDQMRRFSHDAAVGMSNAFAAFFFDVMEGRIRTLRDAFKSLFTYLQQALASAAAMAAGNALGSAIFGGLAGTSAQPPVPPVAPSSSAMGIGVWGDSFADGGYLGGTSNGWVPVKGYAFGGPIYDRPHVAMIGEGRHSEAVVPLPDGRSIPVSMRGGGGVNVFAPVIHISGVMDGSTFLKKHADELVGILSQKYALSMRSRAAMGA